MMNTSTEIAGAADGDFPRQASGARPLSMLAVDGPGSFQDLLPIMANVLHAVTRAQRSQRHCDLDPRKILLQQDGSIHILPLHESEGDKTSLLSSFKYSSPELLRGDTAVDPALSHSYVLGFVFYELLLGRKMFDEQFSQVRRGEGGGWLIWHIDSNRRATPLRPLLPGVPVFVSDAIEKMMAKNPAERSSDLERTAGLFERFSQSTAVYRALPGAVAAQEKIPHASVVQAGPRPWLMRLGALPLWKALWRRVTPDDPRPGQASIQEVERVLRRVEAVFLHRRSRSNAGTQNKRPQPRDRGKFSA